MTSGKRILIADDTDDMRMLLRMVLMRANATIVGEAEDGEQALEMWRAARPPEIFAVILDQRMPGRTGLQVAEAILKETPNQRIILFSAHINDDMRRAAEKLGITACLSKDEVMKLPSLDVLNEPDAG